MELYIKIDEYGNIIGHDWIYDDKGSLIGNYKLCKFKNPIEIFDIEKKCYKYKINGENYILLTNEEMQNHPLVIQNNKLILLEKLLEKSEITKKITELEKIKNTHPELSTEAQKVINELNSTITEI